MYNVLERRRHQHIYLKNLRKPKKKRKEKTKMRNVKRLHGKKKAKKQCKPMS